MEDPNRPRSSELLQRARQVIPGGVNSPVRAFKAVGGVPPFIESASGARIRDVEGREYIDFLGSWGPMILGHSHPEVVKAIQQAAARGTSYGAPTELEVLLAERICRIFPSIERVRLVSSGTEATMSALRLARAHTGRPLIVKFDGCYHGHSDSLLVQAGSGVLTLGIPGTPGVPSGLAAQTISLPFNNPAALEEAFQRYPQQIAAVIIEPVPGNMGVVPPAENFLKRVLELAEQNGAVAIFDEVISGFRASLGGVQEMLKLEAPLTCLGKILGGGLPIGAYGGRHDLMDQIAPVGPVYQAGTLSGNPLAVSAGLCTLTLLEQMNPYAELDRRSKKLCDGLSDAAAEAGVPVSIQRLGSMFTVFFQSGPVVDYASAAGSDTRRYGAFFQGMLKRGVYLAPSQFEACFLSTAHTDQDVDATIRAAAASFSEALEAKQ